MQQADQKIPVSRKMRMRRYGHSLLGLALAGLLSPLLAMALAGLEGTLQWLVDLAVHWQMLYLVMLVLAVLILLQTDKRHLLWLLFAILPWLTASAQLPRTGNSDAPQLCIAAANLGMQHADMAELLSWLHKQPADMLMLFELTPAQAAGLADDARYPYQALYPDNSPFGIGLLSRKPLQQITLSRNPMGVPALSAMIEWQQQAVNLLAYHPMPPLSPEYRQLRDSALLDWVNSQDSQLPMLVAGDFNASPWSTLFHQLATAGLLRATGTQPTWPGFLGDLAGIPIDHVLANRHWQLHDNARGYDIGSDHLPVRACLSLLDRQ